MSRAKSPVSLPFFVAFFVTGMATVLTSSLLPLLGPVPDAPRRLSPLLATQFAGQVLGALALVGRPHRMLVAGAAMTTAATVALSLHLFQHAEELFVFGFGLGLTMSSVNALVDSASGREQRTQKLELLNVCWPLGAAVCPWLMSHTSLHDHPRVPFAALGLLFALLTMYAGFYVRSAAGSAHGSRDGEENVSTWRFAQIALLGFIAVGVESAVANWLPTFNLAPRAQLRSALPFASVFWVGILVSRIAASRWLHTIDSPHFVPLCASICGSALFCLCLLHSAVTDSVCTLIAALALGPVYPILIAAGLRLRWKGLIFFSAGLGSVTIPWIVGHVTIATGSLRVGLLTTVAGCFFFVLMSRATPSGRHRSL